MNDQRSVTDQLRDLVNHANASGMYDAADWILIRIQRDARSRYRNPQSEPCCAADPAVLICDGEHR